MRRALPSLIALLILLGAGFIYRTELFTTVRQLYALALPCSIPLTYSIGEIDERFDISKAEVRTTLEGAEQVWEGEIHRNLFQYVESGGDVVVSFVYDDRQATYEKLRSLGLVITSNKESYDDLNAQYKQQRAAYDARAAAFDAQNAQFKTDAEAYEAEVKRVNARGGARGAEYDRLQAEKQSLDTRHAALVQLEQQLNAEVKNLNEMVATLNGLAAKVNASADRYNTTASGQQEEFEEAVYRSRAGSATITVYEFDTRTRLERVLAHELGHALGLEHVSGATSIMYRLNQGSNLDATPEDIAALQRVCRIAS